MLIAITNHGIHKKERNYIISGENGGPLSRWTGLACASLCAHPCARVTHRSSDGFPCPPAFRSKKRKIQIGIRILPRTRHVVHSRLTAEKQGGDRLSPCRRYHAPAPRVALPWGCSSRCTDTAPAAPAPRHHGAHSPRA
jgi:hypothetical protein